MAIGDPYQTLEYMERGMLHVRYLLNKSSTVLQNAGIPYAVIGGNAIAAWVETINPKGARNTNDVDLLLRREDFVRAKALLEADGFTYYDVMGVTVFLDAPEGNPSDGIHILWANEKVRENYATSNPDPAESSIVGDRRILNLESLVRMKLNSFRRKDQVHLQDLLRVGLIDADWPKKYPPQLAARLQEILDDPEG
ncbi:MAG: hypothetical protein QM811_02045 [Pirellulales bacterium]